VGELLVRVESKDLTGKLVLKGYTQKRRGTRKTKEKRFKFREEHEIIHPISDAGANLRRRRTDSGIAEVSINQYYPQALQKNIQDIHFKE